MRNFISKWEYAPRFGLIAIFLALLAIGASIFLAVAASLGRDLNISSDIEAILAQNFLDFIPWIIIGLVVAFIHPLGTFLMFFVAGYYIFLSWKIVLMKHRLEAFPDSTNQAIFLFAISPPGLLIGTSAILLFLWHRRFRNWNDLPTTKNQSQITNN